MTTVLIDTSPDLRLQTAAARATRLDAALLTHDHADPAHGIDDLRAFFIRHRRRIPLYADTDTRRTLERRFDYIFESQSGYPAICDAHPLPPHGERWTVDGPSGPVPVESFAVDHGPVSCAGFRLGPVGYAPDAVRMPDAALEALAGVEVLIVDALRDRPHPTHAHLALTLEWIAAIRPRRAILTNMHIDLDFAELIARLPPGVEPAYDGLRFEVAL